MSETTQDVRHTAGPVDTDDCGRTVSIGIGDEAIASAVGPNRRANARLLAAAYTSYDTHCGLHAVHEAENDLLGAALNACELLLYAYEELCATYDLDECEGSVLARDVLRRTGRLDDADLGCTS